MGDGVAMAWRAGAAIANMEFYPVSPDGPLPPAQARNFLILEALRVRRVLRLEDGTAFMKAPPIDGDPAPRATVARAAIDFER